MKQYRITGIVMTHENNAILMSDCPSLSSDTRLKISASNLALTVDGKPYCTGTFPVTTLEKIKAAQKTVVCNIIDGFIKGSLHVERDH